MVVVLASVHRTPLPPSTPPRLPNGGGDGGASFPAVSYGNVCRIIIRLGNSRRRHRDTHDEYSYIYFRYFVNDFFLFFMFCSLSFFHICIYLFPGSQLNFIFVFTRCSCIPSRFVESARRWQKVFKFLHNS